MEGKKVNIDFLSMSDKMFTIKDDRELKPIMSKPKIIPIRSSVAMKIEEKENKLFGEERKNE